MTTTTIRIEGMHCDGCAQRVRRVLEREPGVQKAEVSLRGSEAHVQYDEGRITPDRVNAVVERAGFTARGAA